MVTYNITVGDSTSPLDIGRQGEYDTRQIVFDISYLINNFGEGTAEVLHRRSMDEAPYLVNTVQSGSTLTWVADANDTAYVGIGNAEIRWYVTEGMAKSIMYKTRVMPSLTVSGEVPDEYESWYEQMIAYLNGRTIASAEAETLEPGSEATAAYDNGVLTIGVPTGLTGEKGDKGDKGNKGDKGDTGNGIASVAKTGTSGNVATYTITMTDGTTTTFTVTNGNVTSVNGQSGAVNLSVSASESDGVVTLTI